MDGYRWRLVYSGPPASELYAQVDTPDGFTLDVTFPDYIRNNFGNSPRHVNEAEAHRFILDSWIPRNKGRF